MAVGQSPFSRGRRLSLHISHKPLRAAPFAETFPGRSPTTAHARYVVTCAPRSPRSWQEGPSQLPPPHRFRVRAAGSRCLRRRGPAGDRGADRGAHGGAAMGLRRVRWHQGAERPGPWARLLRGASPSCSRGRGSYCRCWRCCWWRRRPGSCRAAAAPAGARARARRPRPWNRPPASYSRHAATGTWSESRGWWRPRKWTAATQRAGNPLRSTSPQVTGTAPPLLAPDPYLRTRARRLETKHCAPLPLPFLLGLRSWSSGSRQVETWDWGRSYGVACHTHWKGFWGREWALFV